MQFSVWFDNLILSDKYINNLFLDTKKKSRNKSRNTGKVREFRKRKEVGNEKTRNKGRDYLLQRLCNISKLKMFKTFDVWYLLEQSAVVVASSISSKHNESQRGIKKFSNCDRPSPCTVRRSSYSLIFTVAFRKSKLYSFEGLWMRITKGYVLLFTGCFRVVIALS